jgi:hypothetical protein
MTYCNARKYGLYKYWGKLNPMDVQQDDRNAAIMSSQLPTSTKAWIVTNNKDGFNALKQETRDVPQLDPREVLVKMKAVSLNYRDLIIPQGLYPFG